MHEQSIEQTEKSEYETGKFDLTSDNSSNLGAYRISSKLQVPGYGKKFSRLDLDREGPVSFTQ